MATAASEIPLLPRDKEFENLYRRYAKDVYHYALALMRNQADAEDVTQTTFMNAYRAYQRGEEVRRPQNWLIKIAHNVARSRYSSSTRRVREVPLDDHVEHLAMPEEERADVEGVLRALGRLPFNQRAALIMRELEGRSYIEIADTLDVSVPAVETLIFRARRSLRIRAAALRSILAVPVPTSVTQLFEGGPAAVGGGVGAGFLVKAAIALVAGSVATGVSSDRGSRAVAAPQAHNASTPAATSAKQQVAAVGSRAVAKRSGKPGRVAVQNRTTHDVAATTTQPQLGTAAVNGPSASTSSSSAPAPAATSVANTVTTVTGTVEQTVTNVSSALPPVSVPVPPLPVQTPPLPKLP